MYKFRFDTGTLITSPKDIFPSLDAHARLYNGRLVAHAFAHLFLLLPKSFFNIINSLMFTLLVALITLFSQPPTDKPASHSLTAILVFSAVWLFSPAFGQVFLWLDGSCNYLWAIVFNLCLLIPFWLLFVSKKELRSRTASVLLPIFSFLCGAFQENMSVATIFMCSVFLILYVYFTKKTVSPVYYLSIAAAVLGLLFMATRPAEATKINVISFHSLLLAGNAVYWSFRHMGIPFFIFVFSFVFSLILKGDKQRLILSFVFFLASVGSNLLMLFASFYPARCAIPTAILILIADAILIQELFRISSNAAKVIFSVLCALLLVCAIQQGISGTTDLVETNREVHLREEMIVQSREQGILHVEIPIYCARTKFSPLFLELGEYPGEFASQFMADYYGVESIQGVPPQP